MISVDSLVGVLKSLYDPPVRGLNSKRRRQRKKAEVSLRKTLRWQVWNSSWAYHLMPKDADRGWAMPLMPYRFAEPVKFPEWIEKHIAGEFDFNAEAVNWMRDCPECIRRLMVRFPPICVVRAVEGVELRQPAPGEFAIVGTYVEPNEKDPEGLVTVWSEGSEYRSAWLEVVGYWRGMDPEMVEKILEVPHG